MKKQTQDIWQWSEEDKLFIVTIPEFADRVFMPCTHGRSPINLFNTAQGLINPASITNDSGNKN